MSPKYACGWPEMWLILLFGFLAGAHATWTDKSVSVYFKATIKGSRSIWLPFPKGLSGYVNQSK
jgi:hypothetical protein